ncbi:hypothetical protein [Pseudomonas fluorescens]|uniref:hypothetical protein n=1 Tax=Pseudomonas fluorescens TaxID=294 RepID=UPI00259BB089|nr:hypothetical protein [Pseudomonas fluorescens]WJK11639.1 hypothetical protein QR290_09905 [Pseudomonas fluorescens]
MNKKVALRGVGVVVERSRKVCFLSRVLFCCKGIGVFVKQRTKFQFQEVEESASNKQELNEEAAAKVKKFRGVHSSRFLSHKAQMNAYNEAMTRESRKIPRFTGEDSMGNLIVRMETENIGEGYEPNPEDPSDPRYISEMNGFEMRFDFETLKPWALYPIEKA